MDAGFDDLESLGSRAVQKEGQSKWDGSQRGSQMTAPWTAFG